MSYQELEHRRLTEVKNGASSLENIEFIQSSSLFSIDERLGLGLRNHVIVVIDMTANDMLIKINICFCMCTDV